MVELLPKIIPLSWTQNLYKQEHVEPQIEHCLILFALVSNAEGIFNPRKAESTL